MCTSTPKVEAAPAAPVVENIDATANKEAARQSNLRRRRQALTALTTQGGGAMQGAGKTQLGA